MEDIWEMEFSGCNSAGEYRRRKTAAEGERLMRKILASLLAASLIASMSVSALAETEIPEASPETPAGDSVTPGETSKADSPEDDTTGDAAPAAGESAKSEAPAAEEKTGGDESTKDPAGDASGEQNMDMEEAAGKAETLKTPAAEERAGKAAAEVTYPALQTDGQTSPNATLRVTQGDKGASQDVELTGDIVYYPVTGAGNPAGYMVGFTVVPPTAPSGYTLSHGANSKTKYSSTGGTNNTDGKWVVTGAWHTDNDGKFHVYFMPTATQKTYTLKVQWTYTQTDKEDIYYTVTYNVDASKATFEDVKQNATAGALTLDAATGGSNRGNLSNTGTDYTLSNGKIAYYPANPTVGNPAGNMIGLVIDPPKAGGSKLIDPDKTKTTYDISGGESNGTGVKPAWFDSSSDKSHPGAFHVYPRPTKGNETFTIKANWVDTQGESFPVTYTLKLESITLEAKPAPLKLTYKGVKVADSNEMVNLTGYNGAAEIEKGAILSSVSIPDPTLDGYVFAGWYTDEQLNTAADFTKAITADTTLYAKFTKALAPNTVAEAVADSNVQKALSEPEKMSDPEKAAAKKAIEDVLSEAGSAANLDQASTPAQIETLDKAYQAVAGITVTEKTENTDKENSIPSAAVVSGAALAAGSSAKDQTVALKIEKATETISNSYMENVLGANTQVAQAIQAKVTLVYNSSTEVTAPKAPVTLGLEIPDGFNTSRLVVLKMDKGAVKKFTPKVDTIGGKKYAVVTVTEFSTFALVETEPTGGGGNVTPNPTPSYNTGTGSGGGGGGGSSSSGKGASIFSKLTSSINGILKMQLSGGKNAGTAATVSAPWTAAAAKSATSSAIGKAVDNRASVGLRNVTTISPDILSSVASQASKAGVTATLTADTMDGAAVGARVYIDAAAAAKLGREINVSAVIGNAAVEKALSGAYKNKLAVLDLGQTGTFGMNVSIAARLNLSGMDTAKLVFYSYNAKTKQLVELTAPAYWIDTNGYIHFTTTMGNCIIVSNGPLVQK